MSSRTASVITYTSRAICLVLSEALQEYLDRIEKKAKK
jgi:hypothetical protein